MKSTQSRNRERPNTVRTIVLSVVYPGVEDYLSDFIESLKAQTDPAFALFLVCDGIDVPPSILQSGMHVDVLHAQGTPAELRTAGINWCLRSGCEHIVFADADDWFDARRVEVAKRLLAHHDIVVNELRLCGASVEGSVPVIGPRLRNGTTIRAADIVHSNIMGLSNTSLRSDVIGDVPRMIPRDIVAYDWLLCTCLLADGADAVFTDETCTYYRQHENNCASMRDVGVDAIMRGVRVKLAHYGVLSQRSDAYACLHREYEELAGSLETDAGFRKTYYEKVRSRAFDGAFWWETVRTRKEVGL